MKIQSALLLLLPFFGAVQAQPIPDIDIPEQCADLIGPFVGCFVPGMQAGMTDPEHECAGVGKSVVGCVLQHNWMCRVRVEIYA